MRLNDAVWPYAFSPLPRASNVPQIALFLRSTCRRIRGHDSSSSVMQRAMEFHLSVWMLTPATFAPTT